MTAAEVVVLEKRCSKCGEVKGLLSFSPQLRGPMGRHSHCKACMNAANKIRMARQRAQMGEDAWRARQRQIVAKSRARTGNVRGKQWVRARNEVVKKLIERHRAEYEALMQIALYEALRGDSQ